MEVETSKQEQKKYLNIPPQQIHSKFQSNEKSSRNGNSIEDYFESLRLIEDWIQKCIDEIRIYLKPICYPLFVHLYLELLKLAPNYAPKFLNDNKDKYIAFKDEIDKLSLIQYPLDKNNPLVDNYLLNKVHIFIPNEIFNFFYHFLNTKRLTLVLKILNNYFEFSNILSKISQ